MAVVTGAICRQHSHLVPFKGQHLSILGAVLLLYAVIPELRRSARTSYTMLLYVQAHRANVFVLTVCSNWPHARHGCCLRKLIR